MKLKYALFFVFIFLLCKNVLAGQIVANCFDYKTNQPVPNVLVRMTSLHYKHYKMEDITNSKGIALLNLNNPDNWKKSIVVVTIFTIKNGYHSRLLPIYEFNIDGHYELSFPLVPIDIPVLTFTSKLSKGFSYKDYEVYIKNLKTDKIFYTKYKYWEINPHLLYAVGEFIFDKDVKEIEIWVKNLFTKKTSSKYKIAIVPGENKFYFPVE